MTLKSNKMYFKRLVITNMYSSVFLFISQFIFLLLSFLLLSYSFEIPFLVAFGNFSEIL